MNPHQGRARACPQDPVMPVILNGGAWTARRIRNNCLRQHCHALATTFRRADVAPLKAVCAGLFTALETRSRILTEIHPNELAVVAAVVRLAAYRDQWLRPPEDWRPDPEASAHCQWRSLLRHLLARYPVPASLDAAWEQWGPLEHFERDCWCALAAGRSPRTVAGFPKSVSHSVLHAALKMHEGTSLTQAIWLAQLRILQVSPALRREILKSGVTSNLRDHGFWVRLTEKFAAAEDENAAHFSLAKIALGTAHSHRGAAQAEALLRLPLDALIRHCSRFVSGLLQARGHLLTEGEIRAAAAKAELGKLMAGRWRPLLGREPFCSKIGRTRDQVAWRVEELCTVEALRQEGRAMEHCVAGYANRCRAGSSAIFSVRHCRTDAEGRPDIQPCATVEVSPRSRKIVQVRAWRNRAANSTVMNIICEWAEANGLEEVA